MSSTADTASPRRRRDAEASRQALIEAAATLFRDRGYDGTTIRAIGARGRVDPALIARYFGHKAGLYLAVLRAEGEAPGFQAPEPEPRQVARRLLTRWDERARTPVARALGDPEPPAEVRELLRDVLDTRIVSPLSARLSEQEVGAARLRSELLVAIMLGISLSRSNGALKAIASASHADLMDVLDPVLDVLTSRP